MVIAAHTKDAVDGETLGLATDGQGLDGGGRKEVRGHGLGFK
jgi:hypothetical protein